MKVLLTKLGLDGHDRGVVVVAMALRDAGMEVMYLGRHQTVEQIVQAAVQEDVDVVGLSSLADAHQVLAPMIAQSLGEHGMGHALVILGGFVQPEDIPALKQAGIDEVFGVGSRLPDIVKYIKEKAPLKKQKQR